MKDVQLHELTPKQFLNPSPTPKLAHSGPKKSKMTPKFSQNQMSELKETKKKLLPCMSRPQNDLDLTPTRKIAHF